MNIIRKMEKGATAIEYTLIVAGIGVSISAAVFLFGDTLAGLYDRFGGLLQ